MKNRFAFYFLLGCSLLPISALSQQGGRTSESNRGTNFLHRYRFNSLFKPVESFADSANSPSTRGLPGGAIFGTIQGIASQAMFDTVTPISGATVILTQAGTPVGTTTTDLLGAYSFPNITPGTYQIQMVTGGLSGSIPVDVADGLQTTVSFFRDGFINRLYGFKPAVLISPGSPQLDVNGDGIVNSTDLSFVMNCLGVDLTVRPECTPADVNGDGMVDLTDLGLIRNNFERNALSVPGVYQSTTGPGGAQAVAGDVIVASNDGGETTLLFDSAESPDQMSYVVQTDTGTGVSFSPPMTLTYNENSDDPTNGFVDLNTGKITGRVTNLISGIFGADHIPVSSDIAAGQLIFAPYGFTHYYSFSKGTLPSSFPVIGGLAFFLGHSNDKKADVSCPQAAIDDTHPECGHGTICAMADEGVKKCAKNGSCGTCKTKATPPDICVCACQQ